MIILPAIDLLDGQVVRLRQGKLGEKTVYSSDPLAFAKRWEEQGGDFLHLVDLNAAFTGKPENFEIVQLLVKSLDIPVEVGGGIRDFETAARFMEAGVARVVIGTQAVKNPDLLSSLVYQFGGERVAVGVDAKNGYVAVKGWTEVTSVEAIEFIRSVEKLGVRTIVFTDIATDGTLGGPNFQALERVLKSTACQVVASGGVATVAHIHQLAALSGLYGAIIGKALYDETIDLREAVLIASG